MAKDDSREPSDLEKVNFWLNTTHENGEPAAGMWMTDLVKYLKVDSIDSAQPHPKIVLSFISQPQHCNRLHNLHGGAISSLLDFCTSMVIVLVNRPGFWRLLGVSRTLNVTYLRPVPPGIEILVECELLSIGKRMCALKGVLRRKSDGQLLAVCEHNKVNIDPETSKL